jgi:hypothetical protein
MKKQISNNEISLLIINIPSIKNAAFTVYSTLFHCNSARIKVQVHSKEFGRAD